MKLVGNNNNNNNDIISSALRILLEKMVSYFIFGKITYFEKNFEHTSLIKSLQTAILYTLSVA